MYMHMCMCMCMYGSLPCYSRPAQAHLYRRQAQGGARLALLLLGGGCAQAAAALRRQAHAATPQPPPCTVLPAKVRLHCICETLSKHCNAQMVNECGGGWESRVRLQHVLALSVVVVVRRGSLLFLRFIYTFLARELPWPRHYHPRHLFAQAQSLPREINSYQGLWFRPSRCIMLSEICGVVQGEFQGGGTPRSTPQVAVSDCAARHGFVLFRLLWRPVTTPSWLSLGQP